MNWNNNLQETAPKTGELILRYNPLQNTYRIIKWNKIHKHWSEGRQWVCINKQDLWLNFKKLKSKK